MTKKERILAVVHGEKPDRIPVSFWRHWPRDDQTAEGLAEAVWRWQATYDFDFIKVTPASGYAVEAWGARFVDGKNREGTRDYVYRPVRGPDDWARLESLDVTAGVLGRELHALRLIRAKAGPDILIFQTIFSPLTLARNLAGPELWLRHLREEPRALQQGLAIIADTHARFVEACVQAGADGIFFATQCATRTLLTEDAYEEFGTPYDRHVLGAAAAADCVLLHIHGTDIMFDMLTAAYPVHIVNWHDRRTSPSLAQAWNRTRLPLMGGINEWQTLAAGTPDQVAAEAADAIRQTGGQRFLLGAGCVIPVDTPEANLRAARAAVED